MQAAGFQLNPTFAFTLLGTFAIYLWTRPRRQEWIWVLPLAAAMRFACARVMGTLGSYFGVEWISWGTFLGLGTLMVVAAQAILAERDRRRDYIRTFWAGAILPLMSMVVGYTVPVTSWLRPKTWDSFLLAFDGALGFQPSFVLGRMLAKSHLAWDWTTVLYYALPFSGAVLYASHRVQRRQPVAILAMLLSFMVVGFAQYGLFPAVGPVHAFPDLYPWNHPLPGSIALTPMIAGGDPRNCMPSLHFGAALLVWWNSRIWPWWGRTLAGLFLLVTAFSTLALGEHYLADLVVAFPFALVFQAAWTSVVPFGSTKRSVPMEIGVALTIGWLLLLRYAVPMFEMSTVGAWLAVLLTVGITLVLEARLAKAATEYLEGFADEIPRAAVALP